MFFIMGISSKEKKLDFDQMVVCSCCGKYGHIEVFMTYMYISLFFLTLFKWKKRYFVRMTCCNGECEIDPSLGRAVASGEVRELNIDTMNFKAGSGRVKQCRYCGYTTEENFKYCPKCGREFY